MQEFAVKFAGFLEKVATRIRAVSVDRVSRAIRVVGMGIVALALVLSAVIFLIWALFEILEIPLTTAGAFGVLAALTLVIGAWLWLRRTR